MSYIGWRVSEVRADRRGFGSNELKANEPDTRLLGDVRLCRESPLDSSRSSRFLVFYVTTTCRLTALRALSHTIVNPSSADDKDFITVWTFKSCGIAFPVLIQP